MKENKVLKAYLAMSLYAIIVGFTFLFNKVALLYSSPLDILAYRFTIAFIGVIIALSVGLIKVKISKQLLKNMVLLVIFYPLLSFGFQIFGQQLTQSSEAGIIFATGPIFTMILATFFFKGKNHIITKNINSSISFRSSLYNTFKKF